MIDEKGQSLSVSVPTEVESDGSVPESLGSVVPQAIPLLETTLATFSGTLDPEHPDTARCRNNLGVAYQAAGRLAEATALLGTLDGSAVDTGPGPVPA